MRNGLHTLTGISAANTAKTHTITMNGARGTLIPRECLIRSLTVSTQGADPASDIEVDIKDNGTEIWSVTLRAGQVFGGHFRFDDCPVIVRAGDCTIITSAAGAGCLVKVSAVYSIT